MMSLPVRGAMATTGDVTVMWSILHICTERVRKLKSILLEQLWYGMVV